MEKVSWAIVRAQLFLLVKWAVSADFGAKERPSLITPAALFSADQRESRRLVRSCYDNPGKIWWF